MTLRELSYQIKVNNPTVTKGQIVELLQVDEESVTEVAFGIWDYNEEFKTVGGYTI